METNKDNKRPRFKTPKRDAGMNPGSNQKSDNGLEDRTYARAERVVYEYNDNPRPQRREGAFASDTKRTYTTNERPLRSDRNTSYGRSEHNSGGFNRDNGAYPSRDNNFNRQSGGYQSRDNNYNREGGGYQSRDNNYNRQGGSGYQSRDNNYNRQGGGGGYQPRENNYNREGGINRDNNFSQSNAGFERPNRSTSNSEFNNDRTNNWNRSDEGNNMRPNRPRSNNNSNNNNRPANNFARGGRPTSSFQKNNKAVGRPRNPDPVDYKDSFTDPNEPIRLNKYLSNAGVCSRREADEYIKKGEVAVNGVVVDELGVKVSRTDTVTFHDQIVGLERKVYVLLNKPKNCVTTIDDPEARTTIMDLVKGACNERIYPVGRLDRYTTGVLLLTNDGDLASKLTHPKFLKKKIYHVTLDRDIPIEDLERIAEGIELEDGMIQADAISYAAEDDLKQIGIEIHSGRNRIVRRIFEHLGYKVHKLDRVLFAGLTKKSLGRGRWRHLTQEEVNMLKMGAFE